MAEARHPELNRDHALYQLGLAGVLPYLHNVRGDAESVRAEADLELLAYLRAHDQFKEDLFYGLHLDIGDDLTDFRGFKGVFGKGSLQIVLDKTTGEFYADTDSWSPSEDVVGFIGHSVAVVKNFFKRLF